MQPQRRSQKKLKKTLSQQQQSKQKALKVNNLFNKLIAYNYESKFSDNSQLEDDINKFFEILLWCQKKCPEIVYQLFQMMAIQQIQELHLNKCVSSFLKSYILLLGNCKEDGLIAQMFLENKLPHLLLQAYISSKKMLQQKDQMVEYIGSYLKAYHRIFRPQLLHMFIISDDYFQLLQISFKFFNCPEPLTQTTVFNIVLDILGHKEVQQFIINNKTRYHFYQNMAQKMSKQIRNQLAQFGLRIQHISLKDSVNQVMSQIQDKITLWQDISRTCFKMSKIFQLPFYKNVLLPLLIGPLKYQNLPLFTLKYSLFIVKKLLKTIKNFGILQIFIRLIFIQDNVFYWPSTLSKAIIKPFNLQQILNQKIDDDQPEQKQNYGSGIRKFYQGVFRSKDNHFILMSTSLLNHLQENLNDEEQLCLKFGLEPRGKLNIQICQKLINQLTETHRLLTIQAVINTLVIMNKNRALQTQLQAMFIHIFKKTIQQTKKALKQKSDLWDDLIQINQYDIVRVNAIKFGFVEDNKKFQQMFKVVFMWDIKQQQASIFSFYSSIPDTVQDHFRYFFVKFLMLRKARSLLVEGPQQPNMISQYYSKFITNSPYNPGDVHKLFQIKSQMHECQIIQGKIAIPALWIVDENFFVLGHFNKQKKQIRIIMGIKYKHISAEMVAKKQSVMITLGVQYYDYKSERIKYKNSITIKGIEALLHKIISYQIKVRQREMVFISNSIKKTQQLLPIPNLL